MRAPTRLTGLASYRALQQRLTHEMDRSKRSGDQFAVLFLDLDRLKELNDRYGHERGNAVLRGGGGRDSPERSARPILRPGTAVTSSWCC